MSNLQEAAALRRIFIQVARTVSIPEETAASLAHRICHLSGKTPDPKDVALSLLKIAKDMPSPQASLTALYRAIDQLPITGPDEIAKDLYVSWKAHLAEVRKAQIEFNQGLERLVEKDGLDNVSRMSRRQVVDRLARAAL